MAYADKEKAKEYQKMYQKQYKADRLEYFKDYRVGDHYKSLCKKYYIRRKAIGAMAAQRYVRKATVSGELPSLSKNYIECEFCENRATVPCRGIAAGVKISRFAKSMEMPKNISVWDLGGAYGKN